MTGPDRAPVVAFVNALGATVEMWREQIEMLSTRYRCLAYDARGHGRSGFNPAPMSIASYAGDLAALLDALEIERAGIVGASIGGMTAQAFASNHPRRVDRLLLVATTPKMPEAGVWTARAAEVREVGLEELARKTMTPRWFSDVFAVQQPARVEETRRLFTEVQPESYALACEAMAEMDLRQTIAGIAAPTLVMAGADDPATPPSMAESIRAGIGGSTLIVLPNAAHMFVIERSRAASAWISAFLAMKSPSP